MQYLIVILGTLIAVAGLVVAARPALILDMGRRYANRSGLRILAVVVRLALGLALVLYAERSAFPLTLAILGWLSIAAAMLILAMGRQRLTRLILWATGFGAPYARAAGFVAMLFGGFLVYAVLP